MSRGEVVVKLFKKDFVYLFEREGESKQSGGWGWQREREKQPPPLCREPKD